MESMCTFNTHTWYASFSYASHTIWFFLLCFVLCVAPARIKEDVLLEAHSAMECYAFGFKTETCS